MIEYIIRDTEHDIEQRGEAEAVFLLTANEPVEGREDTTVHGCFYYGPDRAHNMVGAFAQAMLKRQARVIRQIYIQLYNLSNIDKEFARKMVRLSLEDMNHLFDELKEGSKEEAADDQDFLELMRDAGMLDEGRRRKRRNRWRR